VQALEARVADARREKDDLVARCAQSAEDLVEAHEMNKQYEQRIADMSAQVGMVSKQVQSKDVSLANLVSARQTLSTRMSELEGELESERAEKKALAQKLQDSLTHAQLTETRGIGLEKRVRDLMEQSKELSALKDQIRDRDVEIERQQTRIVELESALKHTQESLTMLGEKDATINEWVRRNNALLQELENAHNEKARMQEQLQAMSHQLSNATGKTDELQRQLEKASDSMLLSDKILIVSKEQTAAISQVLLQERLEEQEVLLRAKERERQDLETASRRDNSNLRDQIMHLTQSNQALQNECENLKDGMQSNMIQRREVSQSQMDEIHDQLMSAIDQKQNHYMEANRLRLRQQRLQASMVHRLFHLKCQPLVAEALHAWQQLAEESRGSRVVFRSMPSTSSGPLRASAPPPSTQGFVATVEVNDASGHVVLSSGASYVLEKSNPPPINFAPSNYAALPSDVQAAPAHSDYTKDWSNPRTVRLTSSNSSTPMPMSESGSALPYQHSGTPPAIPAPNSFHHSEYPGAVSYQRSGTPPAIGSPYQSSLYQAPQQSSPSRGSLPPDAPAWQASPYHAPQQTSYRGEPQRPSPSAVHIQNPYAIPQQQSPTMSAPQVLQAAPYQAPQHQPQLASNPYQQPHTWAPQVRGNGMMGDVRGFDTTEIIL